MSDRLKGKRAVVTAAAAGIGRACAIAFAREGPTVNPMPRRMKAFLPAMIAGGGGSIVNISSCAALRPPANRYVYSSSKAAVSLLTRAVASDFITQGIRCNSICPGTVETPSMLARAAAAGPDGREKFVARQKMGRLGTADEIASMAIYLARDEVAFP